MADAPRKYWSQSGKPIETLDPEQWMAQAAELGAGGRCRSCGGPLPKGGCFVCRSRQIPPGDPVADVLSRADELRRKYG